MTTPSQLICPNTGRKFTPGPRYTALSERLAAWRANKRLTLHQAAALVGLSVGYICDLEKGKEPVTTAVFRKYHGADATAFPIADAGLLI